MVSVNKINILYAVTLSMLTQFQLSCVNKPQVDFGVTLKLWHQRGIWFWNDCYGNYIVETYFKLGIYLMG